MSDDTYTNDSVEYRISFNVYMLTVLTYWLKCRFARTTVVIICDIIIFSSSFNRGAKAGH